MALKWGNTVVTAVKWGNTTCTAVYWGNTKVWPDAYNLTISITSGNSNTYINVYNQTTGTQLEQVKGRGSSKTYSITSGNNISITCYASGLTIYTTITSVYFSNGTQYLSGYNSTSGTFDMPSAAVTITMQAYSS